MRNFLGFPCMRLRAAEIEGKIDGPVLPPSLLVSIKLALFKQIMCILRWDPKSDCLPRIELFTV